MGAFHSPVKRVDHRGKRAILCNMKHVLLSLALFSTPLAAETCPEAPPIQAQEDRIFAQMSVVPDQNNARILNAALWELWLEAPDPYSQGLLDSAMAQMRYANFERAEDELTQLVQYCPWYAEGWNQRAFTYYLTDRFVLALADLDAALAVNPRHLGALTGKALTLIKLDRNAEAQPILREALALNPWLSERALLTDAPL